MTLPRLSYFDFPGSRGKECRLAFYLNDVAFEDVRVPFKVWPEKKESTPFGKLPLLELEGKSALSETNAILAYIGRTYGLHPTDAWEAARHEAIFSVVEEYRAEAGKTSSKDDEERKRLRGEFSKGYLSDWAAALEEQVIGPFFTGDQIHLVDLKIYVILDALFSGVFEFLELDAFDRAPKLRALHAAVKEHPKVAEWESKHPAKKG